MHLHVNAYQQMQHVFTQMAFFDLKYGSDLLDRDGRAAAELAQGRGGEG